jgi:hypothetical protein
MRTSACLLVVLFALPAFGAEGKNTPASGWAGNARGGFAGNLTSRVKFLRHDLRGRPGEGKEDLLIERQGDKLKIVASGRAFGGRDNVGDIVETRVDRKTGETRLRVRFGADFAEHQVDAAHGMTGSSFVKPLEFLNTPITDGRAEVIMTFRKDGSLAVSSQAEIDRGAPRPGTFGRPLVGRLYVGALFRGTAKASMEGTLQPSADYFDLYFPAAKK